MVYPHGLRTYPCCSSAITRHFGLGPPAPWSAPPWAAGTRWFLRTSTRFPTDSCALCLLSAVAAAVVVVVVAGGGGVVQQVRGVIQSVFHDHLCNFCTNLCAQQDWAQKEHSLNLSFWVCQKMVCPQVTALVPY